MAEEQVPRKTYRGNCHCAAFIYEITLPEIKQAAECNCSLCYKKATIWVFPSPSDVKFVKGNPSALATYTYNSRKFIHSFCPTCGVSLMVVGYLRSGPPSEGRPPDNGFNVRTLQHGQVDVPKLNIRVFDGRALPPLYEDPIFTGPQPAGEVEGGQLYTGGCHCGAVTVGLKSKPLNKESQGLTECSCSSCSRYGATWAYPHHTQVVIEGREDLSTYTFNQHIAMKLFCKICGVLVGAELKQLTDEQVAQMRPEMQQWYTANRYLTSVNLRIISGLNVKDLAPYQFDGYNQIQPAYVEP